MGLGKTQTNARKVAASSKQETPRRSPLLHLALMPPWKELGKRSAASSHAQVIQDNFLLYGHFPHIPISSYNFVIVFWNTGLKFITMLNRFLEHCLFPERRVQNKKTQPFDHPSYFEEKVESVLGIQGRQLWCWIETGVTHDHRREGYRFWGQVRGSDSCCMD